MRTGASLELHVLEKRATFFPSICVKYLNNCHAIIMPLAHVMFMFLWDFFVHEKCISTLCVLYLDSLPFFSEHNRSETKLANSLNEFQLQLYIRATKVQIIGFVVR